MKEYQQRYLLSIAIGLQILALVLSAVAITITLVKDYQTGQRIERIFRKHDGFN